MVIQVDFRIFRPGILTIAATEGSCHIVVLLVIEYRRIDVHKAIERTAIVVVTAKDTRTVTTDECYITAKVDVRLNNIAGLLVAHTIGTAEDTVQMDGRACRHVDDGTAGDTLLIAGAEDILQLTT